MSHVITASQYPPNPKAMKAPPQPPAAESGVLKVTSDIKDSLVAKVERVPVLRTCSICGKSKPLTEYHTNRARKDLLDPRCKVCTKAYKLELKRRRELGEIPPEKKRVLPAPEPDPVQLPDIKTTTTGQVRITSEQILARGAEIQRAVATAEVIAAVSLLLGLPRESCDKVIAMVQTFYQIGETHGSSREES